MPDLSELPADAPLYGGDSCQLIVDILSCAFTCTHHDQDTGEHVHRSHGSTHRTGLGMLDRRDTPIEIRWRDDRPKATVGDLRALIHLDEGDPDE